jgi:hypothetical protein
MKLKLKTEVDFDAAILIVKAGVRYWEDAIVNGERDKLGSLIPFRNCDAWIPQISLEEGRILNWPQGTTADIHYKVCDAGEYWLEELGCRKAKWKGDYVPDSLLCHGDTGFGDYIIMKVEADGKIAGWRKPEIDAEQWQLQ